MTEVQESERKSVATMLVEMVCDRYVLGCSTDGEAFAVPVIGDPVVRLLRDGKLGLRSELARDYFNAHGRAANQQALVDALAVVEGMAMSNDPVPLAQRVAEVCGSWWIDIGDATGDAIRVDAGGWTIALPPVRFRRTALTGSLPRPVRGGSLEELWSVLNVAKADRPLVVAWLVAALIADIPHPILALFGEQGTGKSTAAKFLSALVDPSPVPLRKVPRDAEAWIVAAAASWVIALDNLSTVPDWLSDLLCRAVTGDGDVRRRLYTNDGLTVFAFLRAVILTSIDVGALRGDLADRLLVVDLDVIDERGRKLDADLHARWDAAYPRILGALLDLAAQVAAILPKVILARSPRMADFARIIEAVDRVLGSAGRTRYMDRGRTIAIESLTADPFVVEMERQLTSEFEGTSTELLTLVRHGEHRPPKQWPTSARTLTTLLKRQAPVMRRAGWRVEERFDAHAKVIRWMIGAPEVASRSSPHDPPRAQAALPAADSRPTDAGQAGQRAVANPELTRTSDPHSRAVAVDAGVAGDDYGAAPGAPSPAFPQNRGSGDPGEEPPLYDRAVTVSLTAGRCVICNAPIERYGPHGRPLCRACETALSKDTVATAVAEPPMAADHGQEIA